MLRLWLRPVASFTDAWIETGKLFYMPIDSWSHLLQMRGLKHFLSNPCNSFTVSHLLQMRGLKPPELKVDADRNSSHLLQMRGLKLIGSRPPVALRSRIFYRCVD